MLKRCGARRVRSIAWVFAFFALCGVPAVGADRVVLGEEFTSLY